MATTYTIEIDDFTGKARLTVIRPTYKKVLLLDRAKISLETETTEFLDDPDSEGFRWVKRLPTGRCSFTLAGNMVTS